MKESHEKIWALSCYDCLRDYYNQQYHGLLNWRVTLDLASIAANESTKLNFKQPYWSAYLNETLLTTLENKLKGQRLTDGDNYFIKTDHQMILLTHAFWSDAKNTTIKNKFDADVKELNILDAIAKSKF